MCCVMSGWGVVSVLCYELVGCNQLCFVMGWWGVVCVLCYEWMGCSQCAVLWVGGV